MRKRAARDDCTAATPAAHQNGEQAPQEDAAIDTLGAVLRTMGSYAFDVDGLDPAGFKRLCEAWALHVLVCTPHPGADSLSEAPSGRREWARVRQFFAESRREEHLKVREALSNLREGLWAFIDTFSASLLQEQASDARVAQHLQRLRSVVDHRSTEEIKREVLTTVSAIVELAEARRREQRVQIEALGTRIAALASELQQIREESMLDGFTRILNRSAFEAHLARSANLRLLFGQPACLLMIDLDHFKEINDNYGHPAGDSVIRAAADTLVRTFPRRNDCVARYGGEEFAVILTDTSAGHGRRLAERFLFALRETVIDYQGHSLRITASVGLAEIGRNEKAESWLDRADRALYQAKQAGRDRVVEAPP